MKPRVLFLTISDRRGASSRYRAFQYIPALEDAGFVVKAMPAAKAPGRGVARIWSGLAEQWTILKAAREADMVFVQKRLFSPRFVSRLAALGKPLIFDFDDAIFTSPTQSWSGKTRKRTVMRLAAILSKAEVVIAGNNFLRDYAVPYAQRVEVFPTVVDMQRYFPKNHQPDSEIVLGWIGHSVNHPYLQSLANVLGHLSELYPGLRLLVVSDIDVSIPGVNVENRRWSEDTEIEDLLGMDIGLMPLPDDKWSRGKCALKAIQYMASGLPVVCSAVGANREVVRDGVDGYLVKSDEQWHSALSTLMASHDIRRTFGAAARLRALECFSLVAAAPRMASLLRELAASEHDLGSTHGPQ